MTQKSLKNNICKNQYRFCLYIQNETHPEISR